MVGVLIARVVLAAVFVLAAAGKLADRPGTRAAVTSFGAPARMVSAIAIALPLAELAVAVALLVPATAIAGAIGALVLLAIFSTAIALNLARGNRPDCHCFGQVHSEPIGASTLVRNGALAVVAGFVIAFGLEDAGPSAVAWIVSSPGVALATGLAVGLAAATCVAFALMRRYGRALRRVDRLEAALLEAGLEVPEAEEAKLPIGADAPAFAGLSELLDQGKPLFLVFTSPGCGPCRELKPRVERWRRDHASLLSFAEISVDDDPALAGRYGVEGTPAAIAIGSDGRAGSRIAHGPDSIEALLEETVLEHLPPPPEVGEPLPDLTLDALDEEPVSLRAALAENRDTLLMFWNPGCGFCNSMRDDLRELDEGPLNGHPSLLVVSTGDPEDVRDHGFRSKILLDPISMASSAVGAGGTPTAVLVGADGNVRSTIAAGREAVLELAGIGGGARLEVVVAGARGEGEIEG